MKDIIEKISEEMVKLIQEHDLSVDTFLTYIEEAKIDALEKTLPAGKTVYVLKKEDFLEKFSEETIYYSISGASDSIHMMMTDSDIQMIVKEVREMIGKRRIVSSPEIRKIVTAALIKNGFTAVARAYR